MRFCGVLIWFGVGGDGACGGIAIDYGDPELGLKFAKGFLSRLATLEIPDKPRILGNLYSCMGITYMELGKLTLAAIHHRKDLDIAVKYNYKDAYLRALGNLGQVYQRIGDHSQAIAMYEKKLMFGDEVRFPSVPNPVRAAGGGKLASMKCLCAGVD